LDIFDYGVAADEFQQQQENEDMKNGQIQQKQVNFDNRKDDNGTMEVEEESMEKTMIVKSKEQSQRKVGKR
jgi:hypothetical protein